MKVLFLCVHNSARSQMAEAYLNEFGNGKYKAESAGLEEVSDEINPLVVEVMAEEGYDIKNNSTDYVFDFYKEGRFYGFIITVCAQSKAEKCPVFPGMPKAYHWDLEDPSKFEGTHEEKLAQTRVVRDQIKDEVLKFIEETKHLASK